MKGRRTASSVAAKLSTPGIRSPRSMALIVSVMAWQMGVDMPSAAASRQTRPVIISTSERRCFAMSCR